jgi:hypothetical protein
MEPGAETRAIAAESRIGRPRAGELSVGQRAAIADVWRAFWLSRAFIWIVGITAVLAIGASAQGSARLDSLWLTAPFDSTFDNLLVAPAARFDAAWYLEIAVHGYEVQGRAAFFPLYPGLVSLFAGLFGSPLLAGMAISSGCSVVGLYLLHRLTALDYGGEAARATVAIVAWSPVAFCLSAVYTEGLFLMLSVGALYAGRLGRWRTAALAAALAAATRSAGALLIVPLLVLYLYGPRADRDPDRPASGWRRPRYRLRSEVGWLGAIPAGVLAYLVYLWISTGDPSAAFTSQSEWHRVLAPLAAIPLAAWSAVTGLIELIPGLGQFDGSLVANIADRYALLNIALLAFLVLAAWLTLQAARRLNGAYVSYALTSLALPLSVPATSQPLMSLPRFMLVAFPLWIALALWSLERNALRWVLAVSAVFLVVGTALFAGWATAP